MNDRITLPRFISEQNGNIPIESRGVELLINDIATACKYISYEVSNGSIMGTLGNAETENVQGETQKRLDIITNNIMIDSLKWTGHLAGMVSEEMDGLISIPKKYGKGEYLALFDPLDGSSNININITVGTIFSIFPFKKGTDVSLKDFLKTGNEQVCAGFVLYGPSTILVITTGQGVHEFTLDKGVGEFILTNSNIKFQKIPKNFL